MRLVLVAMVALSAAGPRFAAPVEAPELERLVGEPPERLIREHPATLRQLLHRTDEDRPLPELCYVWKIRSPTRATRFLVFAGSHIGIVPGGSSAEVVLLSSEAEELARWSFSTGWRIDLQSADLRYDDELKAHLLVIHSAPVVNGRNVAAQYFALERDALLFVRMEDDRAQPLRNDYATPNHTLGGDPPGRGAQGWTALLSSPHPAAQLAALVYLSGLHDPPDAPVRSAEVRRRIARLRHAPQRWVREAATLASQEPRR